MATIQQHDAKYEGEDQREPKTCHLHQYFWAIQIEQLNRSIIIEILQTAEHGCNKTEEAVKHEMSVLVKLLRQRRICFPDTCYCIDIAEEPNDA